METWRSCYWLMINSICSSWATVFTWLLFFSSTFCLQNTLTHHDNVLIKPWIVVQLIVFTASHIGSFVYIDCVDFVMLYHVESYFEPCCCLVRLLYNFGWLNKVILHACLWFTPANPNPALYLSSPFLYSFLATQKHGIIVCKLLTNLWLVYLNASLVPRLFMICLKWVAWVSENDLNGTWNLKPDCREWCSNSHIYVL